MPTSGSHLGLATWCVKDRADIDRYHGNFPLYKYVK